MLLFLCKEWENLCQKLMTPYRCMLKLNIKSKLSTPEVILLESKKDIYIIQGLIQKKTSTLVALKQPKIYMNMKARKAAGGWGGVVSPTFPLPSRSMAELWRGLSGQSL